MAAPGNTTMSSVGFSETLMVLENGDCLTRAEFERRYEAMQHLKKAELIEGVVYMPPPVRHSQHGSPHAHLVGLLFQYAANTPGVEVGDNSSVRLDLDNEPQPDALLFIHPAHGGRVRIASDGILEGAPELVAEVASSSVSYDLHAKFHVYRRNGVQEYVVWRVLEGEIDWFALRGGQYEPLSADGQGPIRSEIFPGLWLDPAALMRGDLTTALAVAQRGLASPEHQAFSARLHSSHRSV
jgi:Uma2 family endonuclease